MMTFENQFSVYQVGITIKERLFRIITLVTFSYLLKKYSADIKCYFLKVQSVISMIVYLYDCFPIV